MHAPERRRRRPAVSCSLCRRRKIRCNRELPCNNCVKSGHQDCEYEVPPLRPRQQLPDQHTLNHNSPQGLTSSVSTMSKGSPHHPSSVVSSATNITSAISSQPSPWEVESMKDKISQLEEQLSRGNAKADLQEGARSATLSQGHLDLGFWGQALPLKRSVAHKTRLFGQSHWMSSGVILFHDIIDMVAPIVQDENSDGVRKMVRCKALARRIKSDWAPSWPCPPTYNLPSKDLADELLDHYLRTTESLYRILHVPTFRSDYEALWISGGQPSMAFIVQLKLVLAIGAVTYDDHFSLRPEATKWVYEALTWLSEPTFKSRLNIQGMQTEILVLIAREVVNIGGDLTWLSTGTLHRMAVYMGLHRDPTNLPKRSTYITEMRRRLWNTILEVTLQCSLLAGGSPYYSLEDFDTQPPGNFDDDQLVTDDPVPKANTEFTQTSVAIAFRETYAVRHEIVRFLNDLATSGTYKETLRLDSLLRGSYRNLRQKLQRGPSGTSSPYQLELRMVDFIMNRYLSCLHMPFYGYALEDTAFAYARKVVLETSLKVWYAAFPSASIGSGKQGTNEGFSAQDDFVRYAICGSGFFRAAAFWAAVMIAVEFRNQLREVDSLSPVPVRADLLLIVEDAPKRILCSIKAGETNIKGYVLIRIVGAQIEALMHGRAKDELPQIMAKTFEDAEQTCIPILESMLAAQGEPEGSIDDGFEQMSLNMPTNMTDEWDLAMFDFPFATNSMDWMLNDTSSIDPSLIGIL